MRTCKARGVAVIDHDQGAVCIRQFPNIIQLCEIAIHGKHAIRHDYNTAFVFAFGFLKLEFKISHIAIGVAVARCFAQADTINDRGVVQGIGNDRVMLAKERLKHAAICIKTGSIQNRVLHLQVVRKTGFQLHVQIRCSADKADGRHAKTVAVQGLFGGLYQCRMISQAQIVIGAKIQ